VKSPIGLPASLDPMWAAAARVGSGAQAGRAVPLALEISARRENPDDGQGLAA
jgi:hypothetical protein